MQKFLTIFLTALILTLPEAAVSRSGSDEVPEVVVTATRLETPSDEVSGTILVISARDIEERQARTVADALRGLAGIDLVSQGGPGKSSSMFLRGGDTRFTLVLVDGVQVNDPSNPERTFDFAHLPTGDIERIEVLFGPQSTLYGSDAIGGVIHIITKKGEGEVRGEVATEVGSFETRSAAVSIGEGKGRTAWSLSASVLATGGISAASEADGNTEKDGYENVTLSGRLVQKLGDTGSVEFNVRSVSASNELDHSAGPGGDDPNYNGDADHQVLSARLSLFPAEAWESVFSITSSIHDRHDLNEPDPARNYTMELDFSGRSEKAEWINNLYLSDSSVLTIGFDSERESAESSYSSDDPIFPFTSTLPEQEATINGLFMQEQYSASSGLSLTLGARADDHSDFGSVTTFRTGISVPVVQGARVRGIYGTGFRAPSIDQLFNPDYGNPDLEAETSVGWDVGLEMTLAGTNTISLAVHQTVYEDLIAWFDPDDDWMTPDGFYSNVSEVKTKGADLSMRFRAGPVSYGLSGSLLRTEDDNGEELKRRPKVRWGGEVGFDLSEKASLNLDAVYVGERKEVGDLTLEPYTLVNLAGSYRLGKGVEVSGRIQNLLDEEYEEAAGYGTPGRAVYAGVRAEL